MQAWSYEDFEDTYRQWQVGQWWRDSGRWASGGFSGGKHCRQWQGTLPLCVWGQRGLDGALLREREGGY